MNKSRTIKADGIYKFYKNKSGKKIVALENVNFEIKERAIIAVLGDTEAGKSSLLRVMAGVEKSDMGLVYIDGEAVNLKTPRSRLAGYASGRSGLYPYMTVRRNIEYALKLKGIGRDDRRKLTEGAAGELGIYDILDNRPKDITAAQRVLAAACKVVAAQPDVMIFDDVFRTDGEKMTSEGSRLIKSMYEKTDSTIIFSTVHPVEAFMLGTHVLVLKDGEVVIFGKADEVNTEFFKAS